LLHLVGINSFEYCATLDRHCHKSFIVVYNQPNNQPIN